MEEQKPKKPRQSTATKTTKKDEEIAQLKEMLAQQQAMIEQMCVCSSPPFPIISWPTW